MGQTVLSFDQNLLETLQISTQIKLYVISIKTDQSLLNGQYGSTRTISSSKKELSMETYVEYLKGQSGSNFD